MNRFTPEVTVYSDLYAKTATGKVFALRRVSVHLGLNFNASCTISVITNKNSSSKIIQVDQERNSVYTAFTTQLGVKVYQTTKKHGKSEEDLLLFDGYVISTERAVVSTANSFVTDLSVTLVSAAAIYATNCTKLLGTKALDLYTGNPGQPFVAYSARRAVFGEAQLELYKNSSAGNDPNFNVIKFVCDCAEILLDGNRYTNADYDGRINYDDWQNDGKPQFSDLRKFVVTDPWYIPLLLVPDGKEYFFANETAKQMIQILDRGTPIDVLLQLCGRYGILFRPSFTLRDKLLWRGWPDNPMLKKPRTSIDSSQVVGYTYTPGQKVLGKYVNIAAATDLGKIKPAEGDLNTTAQYVMFRAGYDKNGKLSMQKLLLGRMTNNEKANIGAVKIVHSPAWILINSNESAMKKVSARSINEMRIRYATALAKTAYGTGEMFTGYLTLRALPELFRDYVNYLGGVVKLDLASKTADPGILYGRLMGVNYSVESGKEIRADLQLTFDCVRTEQENNILGISASDLLYSMPEERNV